MARSLLLRRRSRGNDSLNLRNPGVVFSVHTRARLGPAQPQQHRTPDRAPHRALERAPPHRRNSLRCLRLRCNRRRCRVGREGRRRQRARNCQVRNRRLAPPAANPSCGQKLIAKEEDKTLTSELSKQRVPLFSKVVVAHFGSGPRVLQMASHSRSPAVW